MKHYNIVDFWNFDKFDNKTFSFIACIIAEVERLKPSPSPALEHLSQPADSPPKTHNGADAPAAEIESSSANGVGLTVGAAKSSEDGGIENSDISVESSSPAALVSEKQQLKPPTLPVALHRNGCVVLYSCDETAYLVGNYLKPKNVDQELVQSCHIKMGCAAYSSKNNIKKVKRFITILFIAVECLA